MARTSSWLYQNLNYAQKLVLSQNKSEMTTFLKNIGSNHILLNQQFSFSAKNEYKLVAERRAAARREAGNSFTNSNWRRGRDSNPGGYFYPTASPVPRFRPLSHLSILNFHPSQEPHSFFKRRIDHPVRSLRLNTFAKECHLTLFCHHLKNMTDNPSFFQLRVANF